MTKKERVQLFIDVKENLNEYRLIQFIATSDHVNRDDINRKIDKLDELIKHMNDEILKEVQIK